MLRANRAQAATASLRGMAWVTQYRARWPQVAATAPATITAAAIAAATSATSVWSPTWALAWVGLAGLAVLVATGILPLKKPGWVATLSLITLAVSVTLAIPLSLVLGEGRWILALLNAAWRVPFMLLYLVRGDRARVLGWPVYPTLVHAGLVLVQGVVEGGRTTGLAYSPNPAGGWLAVMAVWCLGTRRYAAAAVLIAALPFTMSRLALITFAFVLVVMLVRRGASRRPLVIMLVLGILALGVANGLERYEPDKLADDLQRRWSLERSPQILPTGVVITGAHNVPLRMALETGIPSALVWIGLTGFAVWRLQGALKMTLLALAGAAVVVPGRSRGSSAPRAPPGAGSCAHDKGH